MIRFLCITILITINFFLITTTTTTNSAQCSIDYQHFLSTKTPYRIVANLNQTELKFDQCTATKFWSLIRHGTRNPNSKLIEKMQERLPEIRDLILDNLHEANDYIRNSDLDAFKRWSTKLTADDEKKLTHEGEDEMLFLAERYQNRLPTIFDKIYSNSTFKFKYTATQRTKKSAQMFAAGLFGRQTVRDIDFPQPLKKDPILRFYKLCNKWRSQISKNPSVLIERQRFENGEIMANMISRINERLNLHNQQQLDLNDIHTMYMVCSFETAWNNNRRWRNNGNGNRSPWCAPFTIDDLKIMEFYEDLKYYWIDGYGYELTYKQACPAFNDLIQFFQNRDRLPKVTTYFTHSGTLLKMIAHLELYRDQQHLKSAQFSLKDNNQRKWRTSFIDTFGTNLAFVLYNCQDELKILTLHQERIVRLPPCPNTDLCTLQQILDYYNNSIDDGCTFDEMCDNL